MAEYRPPSDYEAAARGCSEHPLVERADPREDHVRLVLVDDVHRVTPDLCRKAAANDLGVGATGYTDAGRFVARLQ